MKLFSKSALTRVINRQYQFHRKDQLAVIMNRSQMAFKLQSKRNVTNKLLILNEFINKLETQEKSILKMIATESGRPVYHLKEEIQSAKDALNYLGNNLEKQLGKHMIQGYRKAYVKYSPTGTILYVPSWRYPIFDTVVNSVSNLLLGNCILMHTPKIFPSTFEKIQSLIIQSGWNSGEYQNIMTHQKQLQYILEEKFVSGIHVSGKQTLVQQLTQKSGQLIKKCVANVQKMGNFIVLDNAQLNLATRLAIKSICKFSGQDCFSPKSFFIMDSVYDEFKQKLLSSLKSVISGDPLLFKTQYGPLIASQETHEFYEQSSKIPQQWKLIFRSHPPKQFYPISVFEASQDWQNISFQNLKGPIICLYRVYDFEHFQQINAQNQQPLFTICIGKDTQKVQTFLNNLPTKTVCLNDLPSIKHITPTNSFIQDDYGTQEINSNLKHFANARLYYEN